MKKILRLLATLLLSSSTGLVVSGCSDSNNSVTYNSIGEGFKTLKINSFAFVKEDIDSVIKGIKEDIINGLFKLKFSKDINIDQTKIIITNDRIINLKTSNSIVENDLITINDLDLKVTVSYFNVYYQLSSVNLTVANKSEQEISNYIKNYNYDSILLNSNKSIAPGININNFSMDMKKMLLDALGSFANSYINNDQLVLINLFKDKVILNQNDLDTLGKLTINFNYKYGQNDISNTNITLNIAKLDIGKFANIPWKQQVIILPNEKNLTEQDIILINSYLNNEIESNLKEIAIFSWSDYSITKNDYYVSEFKRFNVGDTITNTGVVLLINFNIFTNSSSNLIAGNLFNKTILVTLLLDKPIN